MIHDFKIRVSLFHSVFIFLVLPSVFLWLTPLPVMIFAPLMFLFSFKSLFRAKWYADVHRFLFVSSAFFICCWLALSGYGNLAVFSISGYLGILYPLLLPKYKIRSLLQHNSIFVTIVAFSYLGVVWELFNLPSLFQVKNPNGDTSHFIPFTFYGVKEFLIRPSAIYFEPGYLGFYIISYLYCRKLLGISGPLDLYLALAGLITQSATYIIVLALYFSSSVTFKVPSVAIIKWLVFVLPASYMILASSPFEWVFDRALNLIFDPLSSVRWLHLLQLLDLLTDPNVLLFGMKECNVGAEACPVVVGNILAPLLRGGLVTYFPIILGYLYLLGLIAARLNIEAFLGLIALTVLMMAKPLYLQYPYSLMVGIFFMCLLINANGKKSYG